MRSCGGCGPGVDGRERFAKRESRNFELRGDPQILGAVINYDLPKKTHLSCDSAIVVGCLQYLTNLKIKMNVHGFPSSVGVKTVLWTRC